MKRKEILIKKYVFGQLGSYPRYTKIVHFGNGVVNFPDGEVTLDEVVPDATYYRVSISDLKEASDEYFDLELRIKKYREELDALIEAQKEIKGAIDSLVYEHGDLAVEGVVFAYVDEAIVVLKPKRV